MFSKYKMFKLDVIDEKTIVNTRKKLRRDVSNFQRWMDSDLDNVFENVKDMEIRSWMSDTMKAICLT